MDATRTTPIRAVITAGALALAALAAACSSTTAAQPAPTSTTSSTTSSSTSSTTSSTTTTVAPAPTTTTTVAPAIEPAPVSDDCWIGLARTVGWPESTLAHLSFIIRRESRSDPTVLADRPWTLDLSRGLLQINAYGSLDGEIRGRCGIDPAALFDPATNLRCGLELYRTYGWMPWGG